MPPKFEDYWEKPNPYKFKVYGLKTRKDMSSFIERTYGKFGIVGFTWLIVLFIIIGKLLFNYQDFKEKLRIEKILMEQNAPIIIKYFYDNETKKVIQKKYKNGKPLEENQ